MRSRTPDDTPPAALPQRLQEPFDSFCEALKTELATEPEPLPTEITPLEEAQRLYADGHHRLASDLLHAVLVRLFLGGRRAEP